MPKKIFIGIDAGKICGLSVWHKFEKKFLSIESCSFWECIESLERAKKFYIPINDYDLTVVIEDVTQHSPVFFAMTTYKTTKGNHDNKIRAVCEQAKRVGMVWDKTNLIMEWCEKHNVKLIKRKPTRRSGTKMKADTFKNFTKWQGATNEHSRDSAMLIFGM
jgi:hypothetical protein